MVNRKNYLKKKMKGNFRLIAIVFAMFLYGTGMFMIGHSKGYNLAYNSFYPASIGGGAQSTTPNFTGQELFDAANAHRRSKGVPEIQLDSRFCNNLVARWQALSQPESFGHEGLDEWAEEWLPDGVTYVENFAYGNNPEEIIAKWVGSPGHRLVLENPDFKYGCAYAAQGTGVLLLAHF